MTFDDARDRHPTFGFAAYAYEAGGPVMLEVHTPGGIFTFTRPTLAEAVAAAFPPEPEPEPGNAFD